MYETVYHGVPVVTIPVFCDHDANAAKAQLDGYAIKLELEDISVDALYHAITQVIMDPKYRREVHKRQRLLKDQNETPLSRAVYWTEYVLRHKGADHLRPANRFLSHIEYYLVDVICIYCLLFISCYYSLRAVFYFISRVPAGEKIKLKTN